MFLKLIPLILMMELGVLMFKMRRILKYLEGFQLL
nr:MAG TPA: hypothetical protein [Bacteriophage sp.]DAX06047.1 MAG TPA: hypothetical protein [Bacteriophage sp.]